MNKINYEERAEVYTDALNTFGVNAQLAKAMEELTEVQLEICRMVTGRGNFHHLAEEVADATIMLEQVRHIFAINDEVCRVMDAKVLRLRHRIEEAKTGKALLFDNIVRPPDPAALRKIFGEEGFGDGFGG